MKDLLIKAKLLLMPLWGKLVTLWGSLLGKWNAFLVKLSTVEIPILKKKLSPRTIGVSLLVLVALIALICLKSCGKEDDMLLIEIIIILYGEIGKDV